MPSAGSTYFITKYKLARNGIAALEAPPCSHHEESYEGLVSTPYRSAFATKVAEDGLEKLLKVNGKDIKRTEEFLKKRRDDLKRNQSEKGNIEANGRNNDEQAVVLPTNIILRVRNSPLAAPELTQSGSSSSVRRSKIKYHSNSTFTPPRVLQNYSSPAMQPNPTSLALAEPQIPRKRKNEGLFGLETASKRLHLGCCRPALDHVAAKPFHADDYDYKTPPSNSIPNSQKVNMPVIPLQRAITRHTTAKGAKLHAPEGDNFNRDGGLKRNLPTCVPISSATKGEIKSDLLTIASRKREEEKHRSLCEELKAFARRHGCEEAPDRVYWHEKGGDLEKEKTEAIKRNEGEAKICFDSELTFHRQNRAHKHRWERLVADFSTKETVMMKEADTNGVTPALTALVKATDEASKKLDEFESWWKNWKKEGPALDPAKNAIKALLAFQRQVIIHKQHFRELKGDASQKTIGLIHSRDRNGLGPHLEALILETDAAWKEMEDFKIWRENWTKERLPQIAKLQVQAKIEAARARGLNSYKRDLQRDHCVKYRVAHRCAELAKQNVEAKAKLSDMAREINTIDRMIGKDINGYHLSGVPVHMRMLGKSKKNHRNMWNGLHDAFRIGHPVVIPSRLRYELGAYLEAKVREVVAKVAREAAEKVRFQQARERRVPEMGASEDSG